MRIFFDSNVLTYIAFFEGYLSEGPGEFEEEHADWVRCQGAPLDPRLLREVQALRALYLQDDSSHFDWLFSDLALDEIANIRNMRKRENHNSLLEKMIEHRSDVYEEDPRSVVAIQRDRETRFDVWRPQLPAHMLNDGRQFAEAEVVGASYFLTNDSDFIKKSMSLSAALPAMRPSDLPFLKERLDAIIRAAG